jgi:Helix-turn-helix domain
MMTLANSTLANDLRLPPQAKTILRHLEKGKSITPMESLIVYGIYRLSDCILKIRRAGHDVLTYDRQDERGKKYGEYSLRSRLQLN